jgi:hypothetical protein
MPVGSVRGAHREPAQIAVELMIAHDWSVERRGRDSMFNT